jgi:ketosteroid isomerase-like protein
VTADKVEVVRRVYEAAARRDAATVLSLYDPEVELDNTRVGVAGHRDVRHGHEGLRELFREWHEAWDDVQYDYDELIDAGGDYVVSVVTRRGRGRASGAEVALHVALVWTVRGGRVVRAVWWPSREEALRSVGMSR